MLEKRTNQLRATILLILVLTIQYIQQKSNVCGLEPNNILAAEN